MKPLADITVVDLTINTPGPFCSTILRDLGARVVKVEPRAGDPLRQTPRMWEALNRGKESIALDLKTCRGRQVLRKLAEGADILLEGWRPGVASRLGADFATLSAQNQGLVYCSISGFGQQGPWRDRPGHDVNYLALSGYLGAQTLIEGRPWPPPALVSDMSAGLYAAIMVLAAVNSRRATGRGTYVDLSMAESVISLLAPEFAGTSDTDSAEEQPNVTSIPHYGVFRCGDGRWISLGIVDEDHFWDRFCAVAGLDDLAGLKLAQRTEMGSRLRERLATAFLSLPSDEWEQRLRDVDVPAAVVLLPGEVADSPQFRSRDVFVDFGDHRYVSQPARLSTASIAPTGSPPALGEHTHSIEAELGFGPVDID